MAGYGAYPKKDEDEKAPGGAVTLGSADRGFGVPTRPAAVPGAPSTAAQSANSGIFNESRQVLQQSGADAEAAAAQGRYGAALGSAARGIAALPVAMASDMVAPLAPVARGIGDFAGALVGAAAPAGTPQRTTPMAGSTATAPPQLGVFNPGKDSQAASSMTSTMGAAPAPAVGGVPGVTKTVDAQGGTTYSNVPGEPVLPQAGAISPQNSGAATALSDRSRVEALVGRYGVDAARAMLNAGGAAPTPGAGGPFGGNQPLMAGGNLPAGVGLQVGPDTGGFGILDKGYQQARSADIAAQAAGVGPRDRVQAAQGTQKLQQEAAEGAANRTSAEQRTVTQEAGATQREQARLGVQQSTENRKLAMQEAETQQKLGIGTQQQRAAAQLEGLKAKFLASTDPAEREKLREQILVLTGQAREQQARFTVVPGGETVTADGQVVRQPSMVLNNQTGQMVPMVPAGGATQPQQRPVGTISTVNGKSARWDGKQWNPL